MATKRVTRTPHVTTQPEVTGVHVTTASQMLPAPTMAETVRISMNAMTLHLVTCTRNAPMSLVLIRVNVLTNTRGTATKIALVRIELINEN